MRPLASKRDWSLWTSEIVSDVQTGKLVEAGFKLASCFGDDYGFAEADFRCQADMFRIPLLKERAAELWEYIKPHYCGDTTLEEQRKVQLKKFGWQI